MTAMAGRIWFFEQQYVYGAVIVAHYSYCES